MVNKMDSDEILFVTYQDVIKTYKTFLLHRIASDEFFYKYWENIDLEQIAGMTENQLYGFWIRDVLNDPLKSIVINNSVDTNMVMDELLDNCPNLYADSKLMKFGDSIRILLQQKFVKKIYVYTPVFDPRIKVDLDMVFGSEKIQYVTGNFQVVVQSINEKVTMWVLNSIHFLEQLIDMKKVYLTSVLIADCGYNYCLDENDKIVLKIIDIENISKKEVFKIRTFNPYPQYELLEPEL